MSAPKNNQFWKPTTTWDARTYLQKGYLHEGHFCDVLETNMPIVCNKIFDQDYVSHIREFSLPSSYFGKKLSIDLLITGSKEVIAVEAKVPKKRSQYGVYQLLKYRLIAKNAGIKIDRFVLFVTEMSRYDEMVIHEYGLPIEVFFISNEKVMRFA